MPLLLLLLSLSCCLTGLHFCSHSRLGSVSPKKESLGIIEAVLQAGCCFCHQIQQHQNTEGKKQPNTMQSLIAHWRHLANTIELVLPLDHPSPQPKRQIDRFRRFCTAYGRKVPILYNGWLFLPTAPSNGDLDPI